MCGERSFNPLGTMFFRFFPCSFFSFPLSLSILRSFFCCCFVNSFCSSDANYCSVWMRSHYVQSANERLEAEAAAITRERIKCAARMHTTNFLNGTNIMTILCTMIEMAGKIKREREREKTRNENKHHR